MAPPSVPQAMRLTWTSLPRAIQPAPHVRAVLLRSSRQIFPPASPAHAAALPASISPVAQSFPQSPARLHFSPAPTVPLPNPSHARFFAAEQSKYSRAPFPVAPKIVRTRTRTSPALSASSHAANAPAALAHPASAKTPSPAVARSALCFSSPLPTGSIVHLVTGEVSSHKNKPGRRISRQPGKFRLLVVCSRC